MDDTKTEKKEVEQMNIRLLHEFDPYPFKIIEDAAYYQLKENIREYGIITPILVRARKEDIGFEIISGHVRWKIAKQLSFEKVPVYIVDVDDEQAVMLMLDDKIPKRKREPSEIAAAFKMLYDLGNREAYGEGRYTKRIGDIYGLSPRWVSCYISLTKLSPKLLALVDEKKIQFTAAVDISMLDEDKQNIIYELYIDHGLLPNIQIAKELKKKKCFTYLELKDIIIQSGIR